METQPTPDGGGQLLWTRHHRQAPTLAGHDSYNRTLSLQHAEQNWGLSLTVGQSAQGPCRLHLAAPGEERSGQGPAVTGGPQQTSFS